MQRQQKAEQLVIPLAPPESDFKVDENEAVDDALEQNRQNAIPQLSIPLAASDSDSNVEDPLPNSVLPPLSLMQKEKHQNDNEELSNHPIVPEMVEAPPLKEPMDQLNSNDLPSYEAMEEGKVKTGKFLF